MDSDNAEKQKTQLKLFREVTRLITSTLDVAEVLSLISRKVPEIMGSDAATIRLLDPDEKKLILLAAHGLSDAYLNRGPVDMEPSVTTALAGIPVAVTDAANDQRIAYSREVREEGIKSILVTPIPIAGKVRGVLRLLTRHPKAYDKAEIEFVAAIAEQCGIALENAQAYEEQVRQLQYFKTLHQISQTINGAQSLDEVLDAIVCRLPEVMDLKGCTIRLLDPSKGHLELLAASGLSRDYLERGSIDDELSTHNALKGEPVAIYDATRDFRNQYRQEAKNEGIASMLAVPLVHKQRTIGVLRLLTSSPRRFSDADVSFAMAVAGQGGVAIHNAIGFNKIRNLVTELEHQEAFLQQVIDHLNADIFVLDKQFRIVMVNRVFLENHGIAESEVLGQPCFPILRVDVPAAPMNEVLQNNRTIVLTRQVEKGEAPVHLEVTASPVSVYEAEETVDFIIGTIRDVTEHVRLQAEQRTKERLQGVLEMAGAAAHELNTPVFTALGTAQLMEGEMKESGELYEDLQQIIRSLKSVSDLTRKMTRITRYEPKKYAGSVDIVDLEKACQ